MLVTPTAYAQTGWWQPYFDHLKPNIIEPGEKLNPGDLLTGGDVKRLLGNALATVPIADINDNRKVSRVLALKSILDNFHVEGDGLPKPFTDVRESSDYYQYVSLAAANGIIDSSGKKRFRPHQLITFAEFAAMLSRTLVLQPAEIPVKEPDSGILHVEAVFDPSLSSGIPRNAFNTTFAIFTFANHSENDIEVSSLTLTRRGLGSPENFQNIRIMMGNEQVGTDKTFTRNSTATFNFPRAPITVGSGTTVTIEIKVDLNDLGPGFSNQIGIMSPSDITATDITTGETVTIDGSFPVFAGALSTGAASSPQMSYQVIDPYGSTQTQLGLRARNALLTRVLLFADSETIEVNSITFRNMGSAFEGDVVDLSLYQGNSKIAGPEQMNGRDVIFDMSQRPLLIQRGSSATLELRGFLAGGFEKRWDSISNRMRQSLR